MENVINRIAAVHDLSGFGRCSLTTVIPVLSAMGMQVCPLPTAVLSSHTGGFTDYSFIDLTDEMVKIIRHWEALSIKFDCIYSGFLGSEKQIDIVCDFIEKFKNQNPLVVVDPVMADNGRLYDTFDQNIIENMKKLVQKANIITPNITEAAFLLNYDYPTQMNDEEIKSWLYKLSLLGPDIVVITSTPDIKYKNCVVAYDKKDNLYWKVFCDYMPKDYPGTGDIYTSVLIGAILQKDSLPVALERAVTFVSNAIRITFGYKTPIREGVLLEKVLHTLNSQLMNYNYINF